MAKKRSVAEKLTPKVKIRLDDREWPIVITHNVLIDAEEITGLNLISGDVNLVKPSATLVRALLYVALKRAGAAYTLAQVGELIHPGNLVMVQQGLLTAWANSMPREEDLPAADPTEATSEAAA